MSGIQPQKEAFYPMNMPIPATSDAWRELSQRLNRNANLTHGIEPFTAASLPLFQSIASHENFISFRADARYFRSNRHLRFAIRKDLGDFEKFIWCGDMQPPPLYVCVIRVGREAHLVQPFFRGTPFWRQSYCGDFLYACGDSSAELWDVFQQSLSMDGMDAAAREQFNTREVFVNQQRALAGLTR